MIFYIVLRKFQEFLLATLSAFVYLFSFLVFTTSDHQTGVFLASIFAVFGYLFFENHKPFFVGIACALMILVKAYFLPVLLTFAFFLLLRRRYYSFIKFLGGGIATTLLILLPFLIFTPSEFFSQVFGYSLMRGEGIPKFEVGQFFVFHDFLFFSILIFNLIFIRVRPLFGLFSIFSLSFFFVYKDIYYLYLNFAAPFVALSFPYFYKFVTKKIFLHTYALPTLLLLLFSANAIWSYSQFHSLGQVDGIENIVSDVRRLKPDYVYGNNDIAPAVSHLSSIPQLEGIIDTNQNMFRSGVLDVDEITNAAVASKTVLILHGAYYPQANVVNDVFTEIVDGEVIAQECQLFKRYPVHAEGVTNVLVLWHCG